MDLNPRGGLAYGKVGEAVIVSLRSQVNSSLWNLGCSRSNAGIFWSVVTLVLGEMHTSHGSGQEICVKQYLEMHTNEKNYMKRND